MKTCLILLLSLALPAVAQEPSSGHRAAFGPLYRPAPHLDLRHGRGPRPGLDSVRRWNEIAINASAVDHTPVPIDDPRVFGEQLGPCRTARALAIVHIAIFDTINSVLGQYESYTGVQAPAGPVAMRAAISQAAHDTLTELYPSQAARFDAWLAEDLVEVKNKDAKANGIVLGKRAALSILLLRADDHSQHAEPRLSIDWNTSELPGHWRQDPISLVPLALGAHWAEVEPFVMETDDQFRVPPPPALTSAKYAAAFNELKRLGGDGVTTPTQRTPEQTLIGIFWGYDGTPNLGPPPRLYNQVVVQIADQLKSNDVELARLLALVNVAMADVGMAIWESKYYYDFWRPVTALREADAETGPSGLGDGNAATIGDPTFTPLGAPASNLTGPNFTPPFPAYPSGHAGFGSALFQTLRRFYGKDRIRFTLASDEFNGETRGNDGKVRPAVLRRFSSFSEAEEENGQSRIYLGIHWAFDKTEGIAQGKRVADYVFAHTFSPLQRHDR